MAVSSRRGSREVVISFDDGPQPGATAQVLQALQRPCVQATFFMTGEALARSPELGAQVRAQGHTVDMHGFRHPHFATLPEQTPQMLTDRQLQRLQAVDWTPASSCCTTRSRRPPRRPSR